MATLFDQQIDQTYQGLIKTTDNGIIGAVEKEITDGLGNTSTLKLGTTSASFVGTLDLTGATVTGIPASGVQSVVAGTNVTVDNTDPANPIVSATGGGGAAGLVAGTGTDSMKSSDDLTTIPSTASGNTSIALGNDSLANGASSIAIGNQCEADNDQAAAYGYLAKAYYHGVAIGERSNAGYINQKGGNVAIGSQASADGQDDSIAIGTASISSAVGSVAIGKNSNASGGGADGVIAIGNNAKATANKAIAIGIGTGQTQCNDEGIAFGDTVKTLNGDTRAIAIGNGINLAGTAPDSITIGTGTSTTADSGIAIGREASASASQAVALGRGVTAATANTVTLKRLQMLDYATLDYADDAAAATGGIPLGGVYHTSGALKIRIV